MCLSSVLLDSSRLSKLRAARYTAQVKAFIQIWMSDDLLLLMLWSRLWHCTSGRLVGSALSWIPDSVRMAISPLASCHAVNLTLHHSWQEGVISGYQGVAYAGSLRRGCPAGAASSEWVPTRACISVWSPDFHFAQVKVVFWLGWVPWGGFWAWS
jgi:hypothetical protein